MVIESQNSTPFYVTGGTLPPDASSYVERAADRDLLAALLAGEYCYVLNSRQMGKSSLSVRTIGKLQDAGIKTAFIDLTRIGAQNVSPEQWYAGLLAETGRALGLRAEFLKYWKEQLHLPPVQRYFTAIREIALTSTPDTPNPKPQIVVFVDEIDAVRSLSFSADEFFAAVRASHNARMEDPVYKRLTFCLVGSATPSDLISDTRMSPFNVGRRIELRDFTLAECAPLALGFGSVGTPLAASAVTTQVAEIAQQDAETARRDAASGVPTTSTGARLLDRVFYWTNGHPYLTQSLCAAAVESSVNTAIEVDHLVETLFLEAKARERNPNLADVSNRVLSSYLDPNRRDEHRASILDLYAKVLRRPGTIEDDETNPHVALLKLAGIARSEGGKLSVRNRIYERVFDRKWIEVSMPDAEMRRQRVAYRRGLVRAAVVSSLILVIISSLAISSYRSSLRAADNASKAKAEAARAAANEKKATGEAERANGLAYAANINLAQQAYENGDIGRIEALLKETESNPDRGFEWHYLNRACHTERLAIKANDRQCSAQFSTDGKRILTIGSPVEPGKPGNAKVWDGVTGRELFHAEGVFSSASFSADGKLVATCGGFYKDISKKSEPGTVSVWDVATKRKRFDLPGNHMQASLSPDGRYLLTHEATTDASGDARVWDAVTGKPVSILPGKWNQVTFTRDGMHLLASHVKDNVTDRVCLFDIVTVRLIGSVAGKFGYFMETALSKDTSLFLTIPEIKQEDIYTPSPKTPVTIWNLHTGKVARTIQSGAQPLLLSFVGSTHRFIMTTVDGTGTGIQCWDAYRGRRLFILRGRFRDSQPMFTVSEDGTKIVIPRWNGGVSVRDSVTGAEIRSLRSSSTNNMASFSPDTKAVLIPDDSGLVRLYDDSPTRHKISLPLSADLLLSSTGQIALVRSSRDGQFLAAPLRVGPKVVDRLWDTSTGKQLFTLTSQGPNAFSPDSRRLAHADLQDKSGRAGVYDIPSGRELFPLVGHKGSVRGMDYSKSGRLLATGSEDRTVRLWEAATGRSLRTLTGFKYPVQTCVFSEDDTLLITAAWQPSKTYVSALDYEIGAWNVRTGQSIYRDQRKFRSFTLSANGRYTAAVDATDSGSDVVVRDARSNKFILKIPSANSPTFAPDGTFIAVYPLNPAGNLIKIIALPTGRETLTVPVAGSQGMEVTFSPDHRRIFATDAQALHIWSLVTGRKLMSLTSDNLGIGSLAPNGNRLVRTSLKTFPTGEITIFDGRPIERSAGAGRAGK